MAWFFRTYQITDNGWKQVNTPDGKSIYEQDSYFWRCMETLCGVMNQMVAEERARG